MNKWNQSKFLIGLMILCLVAACRADKSPATLLQEALYAEETEGDLDKAITIYQQVLAESTDIQRIAAQATYQLGLCHLKKDEKEKAAEYFQQVVSNYPTQNELVKNAQDQLKKIRPETKSVFEKIDGQVIRFISEKYGQTAGEANQNKLYANSHIYYVDPNLFVYNGGMGFYYNFSGQSITGKVRLSGTSYPDQTLYDATGRKLNIEIVKDEQRPDFYHIYWIPEKPLAPEESLYYGWSLNETRLLSKTMGGTYNMTMQNKFGNPVLETFFLVLPKNLKLSPSKPITGSEKLLNFDVYWWTRQMKEGENHVEKVKIQKVPDIIGQWQSVDFVDTPEQFQPGTPKWKGDLSLKELTAKPDGSTSSFFTWTDGWIHHKDGKTKAEYYIKNIEGEKYLFLPWLSGDVTERGQQPKYYVLKAVSSDNPEAAVNDEKAKEIQEALTAAEAWLALVDQGDYAASWDAAAEGLQKVVDKNTLIASLETARKPMGNLISREVLSKTFTRQVPGAPDGEYVIILFKTRFEKKESAVETVTPMLDQDGKWKVSGYYIK